MLTEDVQALLYASYNYLYSFLLLTMHTRTAVKKVGHRGKGLCSMEKNETEIVIWSCGHAAWNIAAHTLTRGNKLPHPAVSDCGLLWDSPSTWEISYW